MNFTICLADSLQRGSHLGPLPSPACTLGKKGNASLIAEHLFGLQGGGGSVSVMSPGDALAVGS